MATGQNGSVSASRAITSSGDNSTAGETVAEGVECEEAPHPPEPEYVSYTHLTLPTLHTV